MTRIAISFLSFFALTLTLYSCKKNDSNPTCTACAGGNTQIVVYALHNGDTIIHSAQQSDTAFIAWSDAGDPPNPNYYDKYYVAEEGEDHIHLSSLNCGTYRIRLSVFDTVTAKRYTGSATMSFTKTSGEVDTAIVVN